MADQDINTVNEFPDQTAPSASAGLRVFEDVYNSGRDYESETGKHQLGVADPQDVNAEIVPALDPVEAGAQKTSLEEIIVGYNGTANVTTQDLNTKMMGVGMGTTISQVQNTYPTVPVEGAIAASGSTLSTIKLGTGDAADFVTHKGKPIEVPTAAGRPMVCYIRDVNTTTDVITTAYPMDELPLAAGTIKLLEGYVQYAGGGQLGQRELLFAQDFSNGASHRVLIPRVQSIGGWKPMFAQGQKIKQTAQFKIQGVSRVVDGSAKLVPVIVYGKYGKAPLAA